MLPKSLLLAILLSILLPILPTLPTLPTRPLTSRTPADDCRDQALAMLPKEVGGRTVYAEHQGVRQFREHGKVGLLDAAGEVLLPAEYEWIDPYGYEGFMKTFTAEGLCSAVRLSDGKVLPAEWKYVSYFQEGMAFVVDQEDRFGYVNAEFEQVIPCMYENAWRFCEGVAPVLTEEGWRYVNPTGALISEMVNDPAFYVFNAFEEGDTEEDYPTDYDYSYVVSEGLIRTRLADGEDPDANYAYGFMDTKGNEIVSPRLFDEQTGELLPTRLQDADDFHDGLAAVCVDGKWGYIDKTGTMVIPPQWTEVDWFEQGYAVVEKIEENGKTQSLVINRTGHVVLDISAQGWKKSWWLVEGFIPVKAPYPTEDEALQDIFENWGFIDVRGNPIGAPIWYDVDYFSEGVALVTNKGSFGAGKDGFINTRGEVVIPVTLQYAEGFSDGLAIAVPDEPIYADGHYGYIDKTGAFVLAPVWDYAETFADGLARVFLEDEAVENRFERKIYLNRQEEVVAEVDMSALEEE